MSDDRSGAVISACGVYRYRLLKTADAIKLMARMNDERVAAVIQTYVNEYINPLIERTLYEMWHIEMRNKLRAFLGRPAI